MPLNLLRLMRPSDWVKNVFILPALVFSLPTLPVEGRSEIVLDWLLNTGLVVIAFSLLASGFYAINDALDAEGDRLHPRKRHRPIASGRVSR